MWYNRVRFSSARLSPAVFSRRTSLKLMKKLVAAVFALSLVIPVATLAQDIPREALPPPSLHAGGGAAVPVSAGLSLLHEPGPSIALGLDVPIVERLNVAFNVEYAHLRLDAEKGLAPLRGAVPPGVGRVDLNLSGGAYRLVSGMVGVEWTFATLDQAAFYLGGGAGLHHTSIGDIDLDARDADGNDLGGEARFQSSGKGTSFGLRTSAGVRVPVAAGAALFIEPQYALITSDVSHYFVGHAGVSLDDLFESDALLSRRSRRRAGGAVTPLRRWEMSVGFRDATFSDAEAGGVTYRAQVSRRLLSARTGLTLRGAYRQAVHTDLRESDWQSWSKRRAVATDITVFVDVLRFTTGAARHRLRLSTGPSVRHRWGEQPRLIFSSTPGDPAEVAEISNLYDHTHSLQDGSRAVFTDRIDETETGFTAEVEYALTLPGGFTVGPSAAYWRYEGEMLTSYGLHLGVPFGRAVE